MAMRGWFTLGTRNFTKRVRDANRGLDQGIPLGIPSMSLHSRNPSLWFGKDNMEEEFRELMIVVRAKNLNVNSRLAQMTMKAFL